MTALRGKKAYFTRCQILASKDRWEMNAAHLVLRLNKYLFFFVPVCLCVQTHFLLDFMSAEMCDCVRVFSVCACASIKAPPPHPRGTAS